nr:hypothetical protein [Acidobacteriota bacterium]
SGASSNLFSSTGTSYGATGGANAASASVLSRAIDGAASAMTATTTNRNAIGAAAEQISENFRQQMVPLHNGEAVVQLKSAYTPGSAEIVATKGAQGQRTEGSTYIGMVPELRTPILVGVGGLSFGHSAPEIGPFNENVSVERRAQFFYRSAVAGTNLLTMAYSSQSPLNRTNGYDRMFDLDPTNQQYLLFGDSSTRFYNAQSNSRLYARIDHGLSYLMFGDLRADAAQPAIDTSLTSFERSITGVKLHLEDHTGSSLSLTGARPDTAYARDIFPGNTLGLITLSYQNVLPGSEVITLERATAAIPPSS